MRFETEFIVPGAPATVIRRFADLPKMAGFMPGASVGPMNEDGSYPGTLTVRIGPRKLAFEGTIRNEADLEACAGRLSGSGGAGKRAAKITATISYSLAPAEGSSGTATRVTLVSEADLYGVLAEFAGTAGTPVANAMLEEFGRRFAEDNDAARAGDPEGASVGLGEVTRILVRSAFGSVSRLVTDK